MNRTSVPLDFPCGQCKHCGSRPEAGRAGGCPVVCARCGHRRALHGNPLAATVADFGGPFPRMTGRGLGRRHR